MLNNSFIIKPYHWWVVISLAVIFHVGMFVSYEQEKQPSHLHDEISSNEIIIGLKKLKVPPAVETPVINEIVEFKPILKEPVPPLKPIIKKPKLIKPKKAVIENKPIIKPKIIKPQIAAITDVSKKSVTNDKPVPKKYIASTKSIDKLPDKFAKERASYLAQLSRWLEKHKKYPAIARRRGHQGQAVVKFSINSTGQLVNHQLIEACEYQSLNTAALKMLERASPMPKPPESLIGDKNQLTYTIPVNFSLVQ